VIGPLCSRTTFASNRGHRSGPEDFQSCVHLHVVPTLLQLPLQQKHVADNTFAVIRVIGVWECDFGGCGGPQPPKSTRSQVMAGDPG
jgi:hypothetical protein